MKQLLITFFILITIPLSQARFNDFDKAHNLIQVLDNVYDASLDVAQYFDVSEVETGIVGVNTCKPISKEAVFYRIIKSFIILEESYPDEVFPFLSAKDELKMILGDADYTLCSLKLDEGYSEIKYKDLYTSTGSGISFIIESSKY